jgi:hypothetical protein
MLGDWLKLLLEWNPEVRGRERKDGPLLVYSRLEKLLSTKVRRKHMPKKSVFDFLDLERIVNRGVVLSLDYFSTEFWQRPLRVNS